jgi:hypothetical protein
MGSFVDTPDEDAVVLYINLIDATGTLGEPPIGRERKISQLQQERPLDAVVGNQHHGSFTVPFQYEAKRVC